jgi:hypothetical protein
MVGKRIPLLHMQEYIGPVLMEETEEEIMEVTNDGRSLVIPPS